MKKSNDKAFNVAVYHSWTKTGDMDINNGNGTNEDEEKIMRAKTGSSSQSSLMFFIFYLHTENDGWELV